MENSNQDESKDQSTETLFGGSLSYPGDFGKDKAYSNNMGCLAFEDTLAQDPVAKEVALGGNSSPSGPGNCFLRVLILCSGITVLLGAVQLVR